MKNFLLTTGVIALVVAGLFVFSNPVAWFFAPRNAQEPQAMTSVNENATSSQEIETVAENLSVPWGIGFLPGGNILVTERSGRLLEMDQEGEIVAANDIPTATETGEGGLLGLALHPNFSENNWLYLYETFKAESGTRNRIVRLQYEDGELSNRMTLRGNLAGANYHDGGRIAFGPNGYLYAAVGDAGNTDLAQDISSLNGKILRLNAFGGLPSDATSRAESGETTNPFANEVHSYGHRNPQGLVFDDAGRLWSSEHGRSGARSGLDEINLIKAGANYGWPYFEGDETCEQSNLYDPQTPADFMNGDCKIVPPAAHSGTDITWAPASLAYANGKLLWGGLRGQAIYAAVVKDDGTEVSLGQVKAYFDGEFGRIRTVKVSPNKQYLYVTTSNTDGRGNPRTGDDKLMRIPLNYF